MDTFHGPRPLYRWQLGLLLLSLPRRLIPAASPYVFSASSLRAVRMSLSRIQSEMLTPARSAAWRISSPCSGVTRMCRTSECRRVGGLVGMPREYTQRIHDSREES
jgi:hypothetical protein